MLDGLDGFPTYHELEAAIDALGTDPLVTDISSIGQSFMGRTIHSITVTDPTPTPKAVVSVIGGLQAEPVAVAFVLYLIYRLLDEVASSDEIARLLKTMELRFIVCVNVDGY
jgi:murein tripeptide amidase MpaA